MTTLAVTATVEPDETPPRVRIDVSDNGNTPAITSVTVTRTNVATGDTVSVRTNDGSPLQLDLVDADDRAGTIYDNEAQFGVSYVYSTLQQPDRTSGELVVNASDPWLVHPGMPGLSRRIKLRVGSFASRRRAAAVGVFYPLGRATAVVVSDGRRRTPESEITVATDTPQELADLLELLSDAGVLLLNVPPGLGLLIESSYIAILDAEERRLSDLGDDPSRDHVLPYVQVAMPTGGVPTAWTWADVMARYPTWTDLMADNRSWADLMDPTD